MQQSRLTMGRVLRSLRWRHAWVLLKAIIITVVVGCLVRRYGRKYMISCSTSRTAEFVHDLCALYDRGEVAGNMCEKLCHGNQLTFQGCANNIIGKTVAMMRCRNCERRQRHGGDGPVTVVLKSKLHYMHDDWVADNGIHFGPEETMVGMVNKTNAAIRVSLNSGKFKADISNHSDVLTYIWNQQFQYNVTKDVGVKYAKAAVQSILSLAIQEEYRILVNFNSRNVSYIPEIYGTCGPAYLVEYTPSFTALSYVLYNGKNFGEFASLVPRIVSWADRAKAALQLLSIMQYLESLDPPVFLCDIQPHNFGVNGDGFVKVLDVDSFHSGQVWGPGRPCETHRQCQETQCFVNCNMTTHTCNQQPVSTHLRNACRYIFSSPHPALPVGLLRMPPSSIATELKQLLQECIHPERSGPIAWKSDEKMHHKLVTLLGSTL